MIPEEFKRIGDIVQGWERGLSLFRCDEVLVWERQGGVAIAFRGDALRIERGVFQSLMFDNRRHWLDVDMQQQFFGEEVTLRYDSFSSHPSIHGGIGQSMDEPDVHFSDILDGIGAAVREYMLRLHGESSDELALDAFGRQYDPPPVHVTLMPDEGSPWEPGDRITPYYNARTQRIEETPRPTWIASDPVEVRDPDGCYVKAPGADFCKISPALNVEHGGPVLVHDNAKNFDFMVTHAFDFFRKGIGWREMAGFIKRCGGLLFPSLAVGQVPAATIGTTVFVLDVGVVLQGLRPYRSGRGRWPVVTYASDAWTETTGAFLGEAAHDAFLQLTGQWEPSIYGTPHFYVLGPRIGSVWGSGGPGSDVIVSDTKRLSSFLGRRVRKWHRGADGTDMGSLREEMSVDSYPYLEAKVNGIVSVDALALCVVPSVSKKPVGNLLRAIGFQGEVLPLRVTAAEAKALEEGMDYEYLFEYSWRVHDAVVAYAASTGRIEALRF